MHPDGERRSMETPKCALVWGNSILGTPKMDPNVRRGPQKCPDVGEKRTGDPKTRPDVGEKRTGDPKMCPGVGKSTRGTPKMDPNVRRGP